MKVPLSWLKEYVDIDISNEELARKMTMAGLEVADIKIIGGSWDKVYVGQVLTVNPHPNADRLKLATVDLGDRQWTVVCGAPNLMVGDKVAFATTGARLIDGHTSKVEELKPATIRGITSEGMICSEKELGISDNHEGILVLPQEYEIGKRLSDYLGDAIFDIDVTPNRADCLSVMGIAHEIAALTDKPFKMPDLFYQESDKPAESMISIEIQAPDLCPRYCATVIENIKLMPSPQWMQDRLLACGLRPISNIVDVTNYVMLEFGQPLHSFDYSQIRGQKIIVRRAVEGETMYTLDGQERKFTSDTLLIADAERPVAVAGIMGGLATEVRDYTKAILLESANFNQAVIHRSALALKLGSEASSRFEKGLNPELTYYAAKRATQLMAQLSGGTVAKGIVDCYPDKAEKRPVSIAERDVKRLLGLDISLTEIEKRLRSLGLECEKNNTDIIYAFNPWWRTDINCTADLVEEVARVTGYDYIPMTMLSSTLPTGEGSRLFAFRQQLRDIMVALGFQEIITYPLTSLEVLKKLSAQGEMIGTAPLGLENPMSQEMEYLRPSIRMGVLSVMARNQRNRESHIRLFEISKAFIPQVGDLPRENEMLCGLIDSVVPDIYWQAKAEPADFYFAKGVVQSLLARWGIDAEYLPCKDISLNPAQSAEIVFNKTKFGVIGEVHPKVLANFDIEEKAFMLELEVDKLFAMAGKQSIYKAVPRYPSVTRDIALLVDAEVTYDKIMGIIKKFSMISEAKLFDLYEGEQIPKGKKSMAFRITYQAADRTLKDEEVDDIQQQILAVLAREFGATLRA